MPDDRVTTMRSLNTTFVEHEDFVSDKWEHYLSIYEAAFSRFVARGQPVRLLEIGVQNGGSLQIWSKYLPLGSQIVGLDIDPACAGLPVGPGISVRIGDASDPAALDRLLGDARFDVIIDDGSHRSEQVIATFEACFDRLCPGGLYVIEDLHCSYYASHGGGFRRAGTSIEWLKGLIDALNADHFEDDPTAAIENAQLQRLRHLGGRIGQVAFFDSAAVVEKLVSEKRQPYRRILTGREVRVSGPAGDISFMPTAQIRTLQLPPSSAASFAPALLNAVASAREELGHLRSVLAQTEARATAVDDRLTEEARRRAEAEERAAQAEIRIAQEVHERTRAEQQAAAEHELAHKGLAAAEAQHAAHAAELANLRARAAGVEAERDSARQERDALLRSTFWRATRPARRLGAALPPSLRRQGRRGARALYWLITPHRTAERIAYFRSRQGRALAGPAIDTRSLKRPPWADFFDPEWYTEHYGDVAESGLAPLQHFVLHGGPAWRDPNPAFDTAWYLRAYPDVASAGVLAIEHFVLWGAQEGRLPFRDFDVCRRQAEIAHGSNLEAYRQYLTKEQPTGIPRANWGPAASAEIRCLKAPSLADEVALFATYSADGCLKPHVPYYVESLRRQGIAVIMIVNTDKGLQDSGTDLLRQVDGLFVRQDKGYDFAAWAHVLQLHREIFDSSILYLVNDSVIGPVDQTAFSQIIQKIRKSTADVVGLTESLDRGWHYQSYFLTFKAQTLASPVFGDFFSTIVCYDDKEDVIGDYEICLTTILKKSGLHCESLFNATHFHNPTIYRWRELIDVGFPFIKGELIRNVVPEVDARDCLSLLADRGFDLSLVQGASANAEPTDDEPREPVITPPPIRPIAGGKPGEVTLRAAAALRQIPWQQPLSGQALAAVDRATSAYLAAKLDVIRSGGGLLAELQAATAAWVAGETGDCAETLIRAVGIAPLYDFPAVSSEILSSIVLRRYREAQIATSRRLRLDHGNAGAVGGEITVSILMPVYRTPMVFLERALLSVICQTYSNWELCIVDNGSEDAGTAAVLDYYEALDRRVHIARIPKNAGIATATNIALEMANGPYVGLLDSDDMLASDTLAKIAEHLAKDPAVDLLYTDECKIDENDIVHQLMPKPDWSPLLLTSFMYTGHFSIYRTEIVRRLGGLRSRYDYSQDYDLALRVADLQPNVAHIRGYHYGWRMTGGSASAGGKPHARASNIAALQDAIDRRGWEGTAVALPMANRVLRRFEQEPPLVSIVLPTGGNVAMLRKCLSGIFDRTDYQNYELIILHNTDTRREVFPYLQTVAGDPRVRVVDSKGPFNFSRICNLGAAAARGEIVLFLNDDVVVISPDWIQSMLECIAIPGVGIVGPKLLYENNGIQHAGMMTGTRRLVGTAFHTYPRSSPANMNLAQSLREVSLISGACLAMRKEIFEQVGGFDAANVPREHSDVDLCLRVRELGYSCVYTPHAELTHVGHVSMGAAEAAGKVYGQNKHDIFILKRFGALLADDPYFPKPMRDILYIDSPEEFRLFPSQAPTAEEGGGERVVDQSGPTGRCSKPNGSSPALDILILSHDLSESGAPRAVFDIASSLRNDGHCVVVAAPADGPYRDRLCKIGVDVVVDELLLSQNRDVHDFSRNFDKVICNTIVCWPAVAQLRETVDTYWYVHESALVRHFVATVPGFAAVLRSGVPLWAASPLAARVLAAYGVQPRIIEYGTDDRAELRGATKDSAAKLVIGVFGSYELRKGQDLAVNGMLSLPHQLRGRAELRLFGRTLEEKFRKEIEDIAVGDSSIAFFGEVGQDECLNQMAACDVILVPSRDDPLPFVALDALSLAKAVVCSKTVGVSDYLADGRSALLLHDNTPEEIARVLAALIGNPELREALGKEARKVYERNFSLHGFAEKLHAALGLEPTASIAVR